MHGGKSGCAPSHATLVRPIAAREALAERIFARPQGACESLVDDGDQRFVTRVLRSKVPACLERYLNRRDITRGHDLQLRVKDIRRIERLACQPARDRVPVPAFRRMAACVAANAGSRGAARLLAQAAGRTDRTSAADGPTPSGNVDRARRQASGEIIPHLVRRRQVVGTNPQRHLVHDTARRVSVSSPALHAAR